MLKRILCVMLAAIVMLVSFGGCGKQVETTTVVNERSKENFAAYKNEIIKIMDESGIKYQSEDFSFGGESSVMKPETAYSIFNFKLETQLNEQINIALQNNNDIESFIVSIVVNREKIEDCDLNIRDYPYLKKIFNLVSEINVSTFASNQLMRSVRRGSQEEYAGNTDAFNKKEEKFFARDKTKTWLLQYSIYYNTTEDPAVFVESLDFKGNLAPRATS